MRWSTVSVIFRREVRDQLRDKRTLFMIFVLPIMLYPLLGYGVMQFQDAFNQKTRTVVLVGPEHLPEEPRLTVARKSGGADDVFEFNPTLFDNPAEAERMIVVVKPARGTWMDPAVRERATRTGTADAVVMIPADMRAMIERRETPPIGIDYDSAAERSQNTYLRVREVFARWEQKILDRRLKADNLPPSYTEPVKIKPVDVATDAEAGGVVWAKLFPFLLVMMSLTGAFYPAVDLCAGEKERGTMETLLICPASRAEIVMGKFLTVMLASVMTAVLNLASMGLTGFQLAKHLGGAAGRAAAAGSARRLPALISAPSLESAFWIVLLLIPLAAFFSAVCLSLAVLARSMKEGQYYMTPLYMVCLPLIFLTLAPGVEINLFYSLVPVTGVSLLLRSLMLGEYGLAGRFFLPVMLTTVGYGLVALRWAIDQFEREDVLFREAERFDVRIWVRHLLRDKEPTPNGAEALFCFALMLTLAWFMTQYIVFAGFGTSPAGLAVAQVGFILTPPLAMALFLTSSPRRTLRLAWPTPRYLALAVGLAFSLNPLVNELRPYVEQLFPMPAELKKGLELMMAGVRDLPTAIVLFALVPAVCEELAFRGYILTGLERGHDARAAIVMSALLFGFMHVLLSLFQQLFNATLLGLVLGLLAVRSKSLLPGIVFHAINNSLALVLGFWVATASGKRLAPWLYRNVEMGLYHYGLVIAGVVVSVYLLSRLVGSAEAVDKPVAAESVLV